MTELNKLDETILKYIDTQNTDYAILLNGAWGSGKTYYLKSHLTDTLAARKHLKVHYISLFGIKDSGDLSSKILLKILPIKNETVKVIGKGLLTFFGKTEVAKDSSDGILDIIGAIDANTLFIFDDLERVNPNELIEIIGYINQFVEHEGAKVILAANEKEIKDLNESGSKLKTYMEKLIRYSINFIIPFENTADYLFDNLKIGTEIRPHIVNAFKAGDCKNLRTLQFVSSVCGDIIGAIPVNESTKKHREGLQYFTIYFTAVIGIEIKNGALKLDEAKLLNRFSMNVPVKSIFDDFTNLEIKDEGPNKKRIYRKVSEKIDSIRDKYIDSTRIMYFDSIVEFLYTGFLDKEKYQKEVQECISHLDKETGTDEGKAWSTLSNFTVLEDNELPKYIDLVLQFAGEGKYPLETYYHIFILIRNINKMGIFSIEENVLYEKVVSGLRKSKTLGFHVELFDKPESTDTYLSKLYNDLIGFYSETRSLSLKQEGYDHLERIFSDPISYLDKEAYNKESKAPTFHQSISTDDFLKRFDASTNYYKDSISKIFYSRTGNNVTFTKSELLWTKELMSKIEKSLEGTKESIANTNKKRLLHAVKKIVEHWSAAEPHLS